MYEFYIDGPGGPLDFASTTVDADNKTLEFYINNNFNRGFILKGDGFGLTGETLQRSINIYAEDHGAPPEYLNGTIIKKNLSNFQKEYVKIIEESGGSIGEAEAHEKAIKKISFGKERVKLGYDDISVDVIRSGDVEIDGNAVSNVPTSVKIIAKKSDIDKA